jgi:hypothetical protein
MREPILEAFTGPASASAFPMRAFAIWIEFCHGYHSVSSGP